MARDTSPRQGLYQGGIGQGARVSLPGPVQVAAAPAVPQGNGFAEAMQGFGERFLGALAKEYAADEEARVQAAAADVQRRFYEYKTDYMEQRRGQDAGNALADFAAKYEELSREALENFGGHGNERFLGGLERELRGRALLAARDGGTYQAREMRAFRDSVWKGMLAEHEDLVASNPMDAEAAAWSAQRLARTYDKFNPGMDNRSMRLEIAGKTNESRLKALLAAGEGGDEASLAEAERICSGAALSLPDPGQHGLPNVSTKNRYSLPADVEQKAIAAARQHGIPEHIYLGLIMQESGGRDITSRAGARGWAQIMPKTAKYLGIDASDMDQNIEGGARYLAEQYRKTGDWTLALASYNAGPGKVAKWKAGKAQLQNETREYPSRVFQYAAQASGFGLSAVQVEGARNRIRKIREANAERARQEAEAAEARGLVDAWRELPPEKRQANLLNMVGEMEDREKGARLYRLISEQFRFEDERQKAKDQLAASEWLASARERGLNRLDMNAELAADGNLSQGARALVLAEVQPAKIQRSLESDRALMEGMRLIENGDPSLASENGRRAYAVNHGLPVADAEKLLQYRPNAETITHTKVINAAKALMIPEEMLTPRLVDQVRDFAKGRTNFSDADLQEYLARLAIRGRRGREYWFDASESLGEAQWSGNLKDWRAEVEDYEVEELNSLLVAAGKKVTPKNRELLKTLNLRALVDPVNPKDFQWEE